MKIEKSATSWKDCGCDELASIASTLLSIVFSVLVSSDSMSKPDFSVFLSSTFLVGVDSEPSLGFIEPDYLCLLRK